MRKKLLLFLTVSLLTILSITHIQAQETTSEIQGSVKDGKTGVSGAIVTAIHQPSGTKYVTTTRKDGRYNLPNLKIGGPYLITVSFLGYKNERTEGVFLVLGQEYKSDYALTPESKNLNEVIVTSIRQDKVFNTNHNGSQEIINRNQIERLPTINRSLQDFTRLTPSANGLSFGGRNSSYNNVTVDGANFNNAFGLAPTLGGQTNSQPISLDAIEQIQVNVSPYDVKQGGFSGAGINTVTRSGTNQMKGSVYSYTRGPGTQGYKVRNVTLPQQQFNYNLRGASLGGAIIKNKLFFFVSGEEERITQPATSFIASDASHAPDGKSVSNASASDLDALRQFLINQYQYDPGQYQGYTYRTFSNKLTARIDWNVNSKNTFTFKYNYLKSYKDIPASNSGAPGQGRQPSATGLPYSGSGYTINNNFNIFIAELNTHFSNSFSNKLQIGYTGLRDFRNSLAGKDFPLVDILDPNGNSYTAFGYEPFTYNNKLNTDVYQFTDIATVYKGSHEITFGTQNYYKKFVNGFAPNYAGSYRFNSLADFYNSAKNGAATAVLYNLQFSAQPDGSFPYAKIGAYELSAFAQDKWRVNNNFTLTYGFRIDAPIFENKFQHNPNVDGLAFRGGLHYNTGEKPGTNVLFSPRVGFTWDVKGDQTTQIRGGIGMFSGAPPFVWISNQASNNGVQFGSFSKGPLGNPATAAIAFSPDINKYRPVGAAANTSYNLVFTDHNFKYPQVLKSSLAVDQKLPGGLIATVEAIFSKDINAVYFQIDILPDNSDQRNTVVAGSDNRVRYFSGQINNGNGSPTITNPNITNAILMTNTKKGYAFNFTFQLQKNFRNLYLNAAYTYSESQTVNDGGSIAQSMWRDRPVSGDPNAEQLGYSNFYQPHRVIASAFYRKEFGKNYATSIGFIYEAAPAGVGSYTYGGDPNNDRTFGNNDLIYVPKNMNDIVLVSSGPTDLRTPTQMWQQLDAFISQDKYLSKHRGQIVDRNAVVLPFYQHLDMNITQDIYFYTKGKDNEKDKHTLRFTLDIINLGNLLNKNWGIAQTFNSTSFLTYKGLTADKHPQYTFPYLNPSTQAVLNQSFRDDTGLFSRWQMQLGVRYLFN